MSNRPCDETWTIRRSEGRHFRQGWESKALLSVKKMCSYLSIGQTKFVTTKNTPISPRDTTVVMKLISDRIASERPEFEPLTPHTLRHTFATRCIERGMNPKTLQIILGHSAVHITMNLYCHVTEDMLVSEMSKFENGSGHEPRTSCANAHSVTGVAL